MSDTTKLVSKKFDAKELELPNTTFIRDVDDKVFQSIVLKCLSEIEGVSLIEGNFIDHLLGRGEEWVKGIYIEQDEKSHSVKIKVEVNIVYGIPIPLKAEEIQKAIVRAITEFTGLHVGSVHIIFKNVVSPQLPKVSAKASQDTSLSVPS